MPSLKWRVSCVIQNGNKLRRSHSATFLAKKAKETLRTRLSGNTSTLNLRVLACFENSPKRSPSYLSFLHPKVLSSLLMTAWISGTFFCKREQLLGIQWLSLMLKWGREDEWQKLKHMKEIYKLNYWREIRPTQQSRVHISPAFDF